MRYFLCLLSSATRLLSWKPKRKNRVRAQTWTSEKEVALKENVKERLLTLFGPIKGSGMKGKIKDREGMELYCRQTKFVSFLKEI